MKMILLSLLLIMALFAKSQTSGNYTPTILSAVNSCGTNKGSPVLWSKSDTIYTFHGDLAMNGICTAGALTTISFSKPFPINYLSGGIAVIYEGGGVIIPGQVGIYPNGNLYVMFYPTKTASAYIHFSFMCY